MAITSSIGSSSANIQLMFARQKVSRDEAEVRQMETQLEQGRVVLSNDQRDMVTLHQKSQSIMQQERTQAAQDVSGQIAQRATPTEPIYPAIQPAVSTGIDRLVSSVQNVGTIINTTA
jgi:hypothetical protein